MAATTEKTIARKLKRWAALAQQKQQIEAERDRKLQPLKEQFEKSCAPIVAAAEEKLSPIKTELATLAAEIENDLKAGAKDDGTVEIPQVVTAEAIAQVKPTPTREIPAQDFFKAIPESQRNAGFWSCLKVLLGETTKLIGATRVEELAKKTYSHKVEIRVK